MDLHLTADPKLDFERVHANEVPSVEERLVFIGRRHKPIVRVLSNTSSSTSHSFRGKSSKNSGPKEIRCSEGDSTTEEDINTFI